MSFFQSGFQQNPWQSQNQGVSQFQTPQQQQSSFFGQQNFTQNAITQQQPYQIDIKQEVDVPHQFSDSVSSIDIQTCSQGKYFLAVAGWDGNVLLYHTQITQDVFSGPTEVSEPPKVQGLAQGQTQGPILGICFGPQQQQQRSGFGLSNQLQSNQNPSPIFIAHSDNTIKRWDPMNGQPVTVGQHTAPVKDVYAFQVQGRDILVSGGWDCLVKFWQINGNQLQQIGESWVAKPIQQMSGQFPLLVTAHSEKWIHIWDLRNIANGQFDPIHVLESPLRHSTSSICCFGSGQGFAVGSIEGRCGIVTVNFSQPSTQHKDDFCFKCHRNEEKDSKGDVVGGDAYTVNSISFNKEHNTFATAGSDGQWFTWNKDTKAIYTKSQKSNFGITCVKFSEDARILVHTHGYDWSLGAEQSFKVQNQVRLIVRTCAKDDVIRQRKK